MKAKSTFKSTPNSTPNAILKPTKKLANLVLVQFVWRVHDSIDIKVPKAFQYSASIKETDS